MLKILFIGLLCCLLTLSPSSADGDEMMFCLTFAEGLMNHIMDGANTDNQEDSSNSLMGSKEMKDAIITKMIQPAKKMVKELSGIEILKSELLNLRIAQLSVDQFHMQLRTNITGRSSSRGRSKGVLPGDIDASLVMFINTLIIVKPDLKQKVKLFQQKCNVSEPTFSLSSNKSSVDLIKIKNLITNTFNVEKLVAPFICPAIQEMVKLLSKIVQETIAEMPDETFGENPVETVSSFFGSCLKTLEESFG